MRLLSNIVGVIALIGLGLLCSRCHKPRIIEELVGGVGTSLSSLGFTDIVVTHPADGRAIVLQGEVPDATARTAAEEAAYAVFGVEDVDNQLQVVSDLAEASPVVEQAAPEPPAAPEPTRAAIDCQREFDQALKNESVRFDTDSTAVHAESHALLDRLIAVASRCPDARIEIGGHTDSRASAEYNLDLSQRRADAVRNYLTDNGVDGARVSAVGYGETRPLSSDPSEAGLQMNRRVEFKVEGVN